MEDDHRRTPVAELPGEEIGPVDHVDDHDGPLLPLKIESLTFPRLLSLNLEAELRTLEESFHKPLRGQVDPGRHVSRILSGNSHLREGPLRIPVDGVCNPLLGAEHRCGAGLKDAIFILPGQSAGSGRVAHPVVVVRA